MTDTTGAKAPWHLWLVAILLLLWNAIGVYFYWMSVTRDQAYMAAMSPAQAALITEAPVWATSGYAIAVFGAVLGSLLLLVRSRLAVPVFWLAALGFVANAVHVFALSNGYEIVGPQQAGFSAFVLAVMLFQVWYAGSLKRRGVLR